MTAALRQADARKAATAPNPAVSAIWNKARLALAPPPKIETAAWIESNVVLPGDVSDLSGPMVLFPVQRGICDAVDDPGIERITWQKCARIGATSLMTALVASFVKNDPCNVLMVQPTADDARDFALRTLDPVFAASPSLGALLGADDKRKGQTIVTRTFDGGSLKCVSAAPRNLRRHFVRKLFLDETDGYAPSPEGNPLKLAENRTRTARDRLIFQASTPTDPETSNIAKAYAESDQRIYEIRCPGCGEFFEPRFKEHVRWDKDASGVDLPETAHLVAPCCGSIIEESSKAAAVAAGRWRATAPHVKGHAGFKCSALISTIEHAGWGQIVREYIEAQSDPASLRSWWNTLMGETYQDSVGEGLDENALASCAEAFGLASIPTDVRVITMGVDVQGYGLECATLGFSAAQTFVLAYETIHAPPTSDECWKELDDMLRRRFAHPLGASIGYDAAAIDAADGNVSHIVYSFVRPRLGRRIYSIHGMEGSKRPIIERSRKPWLYIVGDDATKTKLYGLLEKREQQHVRFSHDLPERYYNELCSERRVITIVAGQPRKRWERIKGMRAEALDSTRYAMAVRQLVGVDLIRRENELRQITQAKPVQTRFPSKYMQGNRE